MTRVIPETAAVIIGSLGSPGKMINCKLGHNVGRVVIIRATIAMEELDLNLRWMKVVLGEMNKGMNGISESPIPHQPRISRFGNKGSLMAQSCMAEKTSGDGGS